MYFCKFKSKIQGCKVNKWVLLNVQNQNEFYCQILNRDVWSDDTVKEIVKENFVFIQVSGFFIERLYFCRFFWADV